MCVYALSHVPLFVTPWPVCSSLRSLFMEFFREKYWSEVPFPTPGSLPDPGIEPSSLLSSALAGGFFTPSATWEAPILSYYSVKY